MNSQTLTVVRQSDRAVMGQFEPVNDALSTPAPQASLAQHQDVAPVQAQIGIWECTPGQMRRSVTGREFSHILTGQATFTPDGGAPVALGPGDAVLFPANCQGTWDIKQTVRKTYVIF